MAALAGYLGDLVVAVTATSAVVYATGALLQGASSGMLAVFGLSAVIRFFDPVLRARLPALASALWTSCRPGPAGTSRARRGPPAALLTLLLFACGYFGADSLLTLLLTTVGHASLYEAGAALTGGGVGWALTSPAAPRLPGPPQARMGVTVAIGPAVTSAGVGGAALGARTPAVALAAWVLASCGVGTAYPSVYLACTGSHDLPAADLAAAVIITESFGSLLGRSAGVASTAGAAGLSTGGSLRIAYLPRAAPSKTRRRHPHRVRSGRRHASHLAATAAPSRRTL